MLASLQRVVSWLRAGYPQGIPDADFVPLLAVLRRRLTDEEARQLGDELVAKGLVPADKIDVGAGYLSITNELPSHEEILRVADRLRSAGWDIDVDELEGRDEQGEPPSGADGPDDRS